MNAGSRHLPADRLVLYSDISKMGFVQRLLQ